MIAVGLLAVIAAAQSRQHGDSLRGDTEQQHPIRDLDDGQVRFSGQSNPIDDAQPAGTGIASGPTGDPGTQADHHEHHDQPTYYPGEQGEVVRAVHLPPSIRPPRGR
jgi:hypothetical protein